MYADWLNDLQVVGGRPIMADMFQGAEAYLQMWERADGVPAASCRPAHERFTNAGLGRAMRLGASTVAALYDAGQPLSRSGRTYRYCVAGRASRDAAVVAVFNVRGRIAMIASTAPSDAANGIGPGAPARRLGRQGRRLMAGLWAGRRRADARYVYGIHSGRVDFVAITTAAELRHPARLRSDLQAAGL